MPERRSEATYEVVWHAGSEVVKQTCRQPIYSPDPPGHLYIHLHNLRNSMWEIGSCRGPNSTPRAPTGSFSLFPMRLTRDADADAALAHSGSTIAQHSTYNTWYGKGSAGLAGCGSRWAMIQRTRNQSPSGHRRGTTPTGQIVHLDETDDCISSYRRGGDGTGNSEDEAHFIAVAIIYPSSANGLSFVLPGPSVPAVAECSVDTAGTRPGPAGLASHGDWLVYSIAQAVPSCHMAMLGPRVCEEAADSCHLVLDSGKLDYVNVSDEAPAPTALQARARTLLYCTVL
ncbi:hypothetical protein J7T55_004087 [Diaporthe amygdali]|uniref:uncharacterized protein n=1 Tax=Phomopsis amygdali TaxID=1214568 RepID=UPI0022FEE348|nr:uncharacterized protein J7T55_004087 [Diaporthe amygdali]KAJ0115918.1 hypothetical protein J7T55_004087 [Diaporthe amygdali]